MRIRGAIGETLYAQDRFDSGATVTIDLYDASDGSAVALDSDSCTEMGTTGEFVWGTDNLTTQPVAGITYIWVMTDGDGNTKRGQITFYVAPTGLTAQQVWEYVTRELTTGTKDSEIDQISSDVSDIKQNALTEEDIYKPSSEKRISFSKYK